jgi:hypothetical protein
MKHDTQNHWVRALLLIAQNSNKLENMTFRKLDLFTSSGEGRETPNMLGTVQTDPETRRRF